MKRRPCSLQLLSLRRHGPMVRLFDMGNIRKQHWTLVLSFFVISLSARAEMPGAQPTPSKTLPVMASNDSSKEPVSDEQLRVLLVHVRRSQALGRDDLALKQLDMLLKIAPDYADALILKVKIEIHSNRQNEAQSTLDNLRRVQPDNPEISHFETLLRSSVFDRGELKRAQSLIKTGHYAEGVAAFHKIFPDGPPTDELALEYWRAVAKTPNGWSSAREGLIRLARENPDDLQYRLILAEHETSQLPINRQALQVIIDMSKVPAYSAQARDAWHLAMMKLDYSKSSLPLLQAYLAAHPGDAGVREKYALISRKIAGEQQAQAEKAAKEQAQIAEKAAKEQQLLADVDYQAGVRGLALLDKGDLDAAEPLLQQALKARPEDGAIVGGMGLLRMRQDRHKEAKEFFIQASHLKGEPPGKWDDLIKVAGFWQLVREAREAREASDFALAEDKLNEALSINPAEAGTIAALGDVQSDRGSANEAIATYRRALVIDPLNRIALQGMIEAYRRRGLTQAQHEVSQLSPAQRKVLSKTISAMETEAVEEQADNPDEFLPALELIPVNKRSEKISSSWGRNLEDLASEHVKSGHKNLAIRLLLEAEILATNDEVASLSVATAWGDLGEYHQAERIFEKLRVAHTPPTTHWYFRHADYLAKRESPELGADVDVIAAMTGLSPEEEHDLNRLQEIIAVRTANKQFDSGSPGLVHQGLEPFLKRNPDSIPMLLVEARAYQATKQWHEAQADYEHILRLMPGNSDIIHSLIEIQIASGDRAGALKRLNEWAADSSLRNSYNGFQMFDMYVALNDRAGAKKQLESLLVQFPDQPRVLNLALQMAQQEGNEADEIKYLKKSVAVEQGGAAPKQIGVRLARNIKPYQKIGSDETADTQIIQDDWKVKRLDVLLKPRPVWLSSAVDVQSRGGLSGMSQFDSVEIPFEYKTTWRSVDEILFRADLVSLNAGTVPVASKDFGSMLLCQPSCNQNFLQQATQGASAMASYHHGQMGADIGVTPTGFPVSNVVGGISLKGDVGKFGYSAEVSRRPVTDSVLSFAGARDPRTGTVWGGVLATGGRLILSLDKGKSFGFWTSVGLHSLTGLNVLSNQRQEVMAGALWRVINEENRLFSVGLTGLFWHHTSNAGEYSFGHGGYFSPQNYGLLSLPVVYGKRNARMSYAVRGAVSYSQTQIQAAPYFPTDSAMQAQAVLANLIAPVYAASSTSGIGYSLGGAFEYQVDAQLFAGGVMSLDRSGTYAPNRMSLYMRYALDRDNAQTVLLPPEPVLPSSQY